MNKRISCALFYALVLISSVAFAQVNVNKYTGTAGVSIPLFNVKSGGVSLPVGLSYMANGVKVKDIEGTAGMNWQLNAGGSITRQVRGLPDDCSKNLNNQPRKGWLYNTNGTNINNFNIANGTCTGNTADLAYITSNFSDLSDTEPDVYYISAPGLSCEFVFNNSRTISTIPYQDLKINYTHAADSTITSFTIVNDQGIKYVFADTVCTIRRAYNTTGSPAFLSQDFNRYKGTSSRRQSGIHFVSSWNLTSITDPAGNHIRLSYTEPLTPEPEHGIYVYSTDSVNMYLGGASNTFVKSYQYTIQSQILPHYLQGITYGDNNTNIDIVDFGFTSAFSGMPLLSYVTGYGKTINLSYTKSANRNFLTGFSSSTGLCTDPDSYQFGYTSYTLPDSTSNKVDYWGYYNGSTATSLVPQMYVNPSNSSYERYRPNLATNNTAVYPYLLSGADRSANTTYLLNGTLNTITNANGGTTTLIYESNDFYDSTAGAVVQGGGIRVKQITYYDGLNTANNIVKTYTYTDSTGRSSGHPVTLPSFAFTTPYTGGGSTLDQWNYSTVRSSDNLSNEDNSILYTFVKESQAGAGSTLYQFTTPATNWDASAPPDWSPTVTNTAPQTCSINPGFVVNSKNTYPFPANTNFDFERGLISKVTNYNNLNQEVSESLYYYTRSNSPAIATGFTYDINGTVTAYAKYSIYTGTSELGTRVVKKIFNSQTLALPQQTDTHYYYNATQHKLAQEQITNSDGTMENNYIKYTKDYTSAAPGADSTVNGIYRLQQLNINTPVESYSTLTKSGTTTTIGASLSKFKTFIPVSGSGYLYMPSQRLRLLGVDSLHANGVSDFTPAVITSGVFTDDGRYAPVENDRAYDYDGALLSVDDGYLHERSMVIDHISGAPVASFPNALYNEVGYNDFNSATAPYNFTKATYTYSANSRSGQFALSLEASTPLTRTITKNPLAKNYVFSIWVNSTTGGTITITVNGTNYTLTLLNTGTWQYYEKIIPVSSLPASFTTQFQSSAAVLIDDVLFYPDVTEVSTTAYDPVTFQKTAATNTNGVAQYYGYDTFNRLRYIYDQDRNIVEKKSYYLAATQYPSLGSLAITSAPNTIYTTTPVTFRISGVPDCVQDQVSASWNFGDGTAAVIGLSPIHSYTASGTYTVTATLTSPLFSTTVLTYSVTVSYPPPTTIPVSVSGNTTSNAINEVNFYQGGVLIYGYSFSLAHPSPPPCFILQGIYDIQVTFVKSGITFKSVSYSDGGSLTGCFPTTNTSPYTITGVNLSTSTSINFIQSSSTCLN